MVSLTSSKTIYNDKNGLLKKSRSVKKRINTKSKSVKNKSEIKTNLTESEKKISGVINKVKTIEFKNKDKKNNVVYDISRNKDNTGDIYKISKNNNVIKEMEVKDEHSESTFKIALKSLYNFLKSKLKNPFKKNVTSGGNNDNNGNNNGYNGNNNSYNGNNNNGNNNNGNNNNGYNGNNNGYNGNNDNANYNHQLPFPNRINMQENTYLYQKIYKKRSILGVFGTVFINLLFLFLFSIFYVIFFIIYIPASGDIPFDFYYNYTIINGQEVLV